MAKKSIGELVCVVSADAEHFNKGISDAEKRLTAFAKQAASPLKFGMGAAAGLGALGMSPVHALLDPIEKLTEMIPGLEEYSFFFNPAKYAAAMEGVKNDTLELGRAAALLDVDPQFLKALRLTAGPLADDLMPALQKLVRFQGELRMGGEDVLSAGGRKAMTVAEKWGFDPQEIANLTREELLLKFADQLKAVGDQSERFAMVSDVMSNKALKLTNVFAQGSGAIEKWLKLVKELGIDTPEQVAMAKVVAMMEKIHKLHEQAIKDQEFMLHGGPQMAAKMEMKNARVFSGEWFDALQRFREAAPGGDPTNLLGRPKLGPTPLWTKMLEDIKAITEASEVVLPEVTEADKATDAIKKINEALDEQEEILRLTNAGWGDLAKQVRAVTKAGGLGGLGEPQSLLRLFGLRDAKDAEKQAKELADIEKQIQQKFFGLGPTPYAPTAAAGSQEAAHAFGGGGWDPIKSLNASVEQLVEMMKKPQVTPEMQQNVAQAAREIKALNDRLQALGPRR